MDAQSRPGGPGSALQRIAAALAAYALYALLAEAAIETFISRSPVRWWVAITVVGYLAGSAVLWWRRHPLWNRLDRATRVSISLFVLFGLLALTVWLPGGVTQGLKLLGQSTSTLLVLVSAVAVAFSGSVLMRASYPHAAIKWATGALATYGVTAFVWAIFAGTSYPDLFHGESFWTRLPRWLQAAFVGALVIVPLATVVETARALRPLRDASRREWRLQQTVALAGRCGR